MDENNNNEEKEFAVNIDKEELKNQTKDTVNQVKESFKNTDFKTEAKATKGFILDFIKKPYSTIEAIATEKENKFTTAVMLMVTMMILSGGQYLAYKAFNSYAGKVELKQLIIYIITPLLFVLAFTIGTVLFGGKEKKSITTILASLTVAYSPFILTAAVHVIYYIIDVKGIGYIYNIVSNTAYFFSYTLMAAAIRKLISPEEDKDKLFRKLAVIILTGYAILKVLAILEIY